mgnify:CR=1 FL=1
MEGRITTGDSNNLQVVDLMEGFLVAELRLFT